MPRSMHNKVVFGAVTILLGAVLVLTGCSRSPLDSSTTVEQPKVLSRMVDLSGAALSPVPYHAEAVISAKDGGTLTLLDVTLQIPPGAVPNDTLFSIDIPDITVFFNEFGTDGLVFDKPVKVTMSYRGADLSGVNESTIRIGWLNERTGQWEDMLCTVDTVNQVVTGELNHFSAYGLISD